MSWCVYVPFPGCTSQELVSWYRTSQISQAVWFICDQYLYGILWTNHLFHPLTCRWNFRLILDFCSLKLAGSWHLCLSCSDIHWGYIAPFSLWGWLTPSRCGVPPPFLLLGCTATVSLWGCLTPSHFGCVQLFQITPNAFQSRCVIFSAAVLPLIYWLASTGGWTQDFALAAWALCGLSYTSRPFCSGYFGDGGVSLFAQTSLDCDPPILSYPPPRVTGMHHGTQLFPSVKMESHELVFSWAGLEPQSSPAQPPAACSLGGQVCATAPAQLLVELESHERFALVVVVLAAEVARITDMSYWCRLRLLISC
jgi:hypothetical protein